MTTRALVMRRDEPEQPPTLPAVLNAEFFDTETIREYKRKIIYHLSGRAGDDNADYSGAYTLPAAARRVGLPTRIIRTWIKEDKDFGTAVDDAIMDAEGIVMNHEFIRALKGGGAAIDRMIAYRMSGASSSSEKKIEIVRSADSEGVL